MAIRSRLPLVIRAAIVWIFLGATGATASAADHFVTVDGSDLASGVGTAVDIVTKTLST